MMTSMANHCLPLLAVALIANYLIYDLFDKNIVGSYGLTANLIVNYVVFNVILHEINNLLISLSVTSLSFAYLSAYMFSIDDIILLTFLAFISNYCYYITIYKIPTYLRSSFSTGELLIVGQASVAYLSTSGACLITKLLKPSKCHLFCSPNTSNLILQTLFVGISFIVLIQMTITYKLREKYKWLPLMTIGLLIYITYQVNIITIWMVITCLTLLFVTIYSLKVSSKASPITRKFFHIIISIIYLIGAKNDLIFLCFSSAAILAIFIMTEVIRVSKVEPLWRPIESVLDKFRDDKDRGVLTLTHIYLLIGSSIPLWLNLTNDVTIASLSGIISVGLGDTGAAVGGSLFGRHRWTRQSSKTYEGTVCGFITQLVSSLFIIQYISPNVLIDILLFYKLIFISIISSLIETKVTEIDNLVL
ncbi:dolichol kinase-like, partial [Oppia nitens]|uniref:dolichol kinase-like n=1 Tax=Oppia nitens TaxID=1686743 RepID=UPI0023DC1AA6